MEDRLIEHIWVGTEYKVSIFVMEYQTFKYPSPDGFRVDLGRYYKVGYVYHRKRKYKVYRSLKSLKKDLKKMKINLEVSIK